MTRFLIGFWTAAVISDLSQGNTGWVIAGLLALLISVALLAYEKKWGAS